MTSHAQQKTKRNRTLKQRMESIPLTPMIDVVFQLLIFFVLTFELQDRLTEMKVERPGPGEGGSINPDTITVHAVAPGDSPFTLNERAVSLDHLRTYVNTLADLDPEQTVIIKATPQSRHKDLVTLLNLMSDAGLKNISLFSTKETARE
jgi:biopolymer transport protein ExbD